MTIDVAYTVSCDGPHPNAIDFPSEACEAEFDHAAFGMAGDSAGLLRQLRQRGWRVKDGKHLCPRHLPAPPAPEEDTTDA